MLKVLHVTPHMGGGVGNVISCLAMSGDQRILQSIILLEEPVKKNFIQKAQMENVNLLICPEWFRISQLLAESDLVVIHWWHHPKIAKLLYELPQVPMRLIIWTHISNLTVPALNPIILMESTRVLFTTEASYEAEVFCDIPEKIIKEKTGVVYGCGGFDEFPQISHEIHNGFNIGYLGLIDYSKLHPRFVDFCVAANIPGAKFILAGDDPARHHINRQIEENNLNIVVEYLGYITDIKPVLAQFDVLGYPLMPYHTCTTENVILESMAAEVPPVLLKQLTEKYIVQDGKTGILVSGIEEYGNAIRFLYDNPGIRKQLGKNARNYVISKFTNKRFLDSFYENCEIAMCQSKRIMNFKKILGQKPAEWFISCLGKDHQYFKSSFDAGVFNQTTYHRKGIKASSPLLKQTNKSSVFHYQREFPEDEMLPIWTNVLGEEEEND